jgi:hypothetical protein
MRLTMKMSSEFDAGDRNHVILQLGFMRAFRSGTSKLMSESLGGEIGDPLMFKSNTHGLVCGSRWAQDLKHPMECFPR